MLRIYKYRLRLQHRQAVTMPAGAVFLRAAFRFNTLRDHDLFLWAVVDTEKDVMDYPFALLGTGHEVPSDVAASMKCLATLDQSGCVWHLFGSILKA